MSILLMFSSQKLTDYSYYLKLSLHRFLGLSLGLLPVTSSSYTRFTKWSPFISSIFAFHLLCFFFTISITPSCLRDLLTSSFSLCPALSHLLLFLETSFHMPVSCSHASSAQSKWIRVISVEDRVGLSGKQLMHPLKRWRKFACITVV